ncbi:hypothetical protein L226DRAFT_60070 [Lentinus tigrinus ALCF2SS1-7]|uniref:Uncharacterized protein n=1 Tax=Lentinus tigrinus ALCF2SS1-6 TaxID=1328759 RepID=A0A5C2SIH4_9APHY|nr:hypothetical protein L227DRAFT_79689 [Lentinus tigrinus ALCF2SS1-6]RPD75291.1 hypothetical protein L226DRAFT_60070 [Lentinus tigrinus ALCF2SS1-7]
MSLTLFPHRPSSHPYSPYPRSPGDAFSPRSAISVWPPPMYRPPPPRVNTRSDLPRDPSNWLDSDLLSYVNSHYSTSESSLAVELIRDNRLTPRALWYLQTDREELSRYVVHLLLLFIVLARPSITASSPLLTIHSSLASTESLRQFVISLAQSVQPAVSPTTPRVKHIRRLSEDFAHPPPPPTPPPPSPSLPEEPELEEDDDVAESVISDWALDGDNDEIHEVAEAPPGDATHAEATPEPAAVHHAEHASGENTLGLDIGGEPSETIGHPSEPQPALSTTSAEESLIDFEDAPETVSRAPSEPPSGDATATQPADPENATEFSAADPQVTDEPAVVQHEDAASVATSAPEATDEPPSGASNRADPPAGEHASEGAGSGGMPGIFDDDLGNPWGEQNEAETKAELPVPEKPTAPEVGRLDERSDGEVHAEVETEREPLAPAETDTSTSTSRPEEATEPAGSDSSPQDPPAAGGGGGDSVQGAESKPAADPEDKHLPTPPESPEDTSKANKPLPTPSVEEPVAPPTEEDVTLPSDDQTGESSRDIGGEPTTDVDRQVVDSGAEGAHTATRQDGPDAQGAQDTRHEESAPPSSPSPLPPATDSGVQHEKPDEKPLAGAYPTSSATQSPAVDRDAGEPREPGKKPKLTCVATEVSVPGTPVLSTPNTPASETPGSGTAAGQKLSNAEKKKLKKLRQNARREAVKSGNGNGNEGELEMGVRTQAEPDSGRQSSNDVNGPKEDTVDPPQEAASVPTPSGSGDTDTRVQERSSEGQSGAPPSRTDEKPDTSPHSDTSSPNTSESSPPPAAADPAPSTDAVTAGGDSQRDETGQRDPSTVPSAAQTVSQSTDEPEHSTHDNALHPSTAERSSSEHPALGADISPAVELPTGEQFELVERGDATPPEHIEQARVESTQRTVHSTNPSVPTTVSTARREAPRAASEGPASSEQLHQTGVRPQTAPASRSSSPAKPQTPHSPLTSRETLAPRLHVDTMVSLAHSPLSHTHQPSLGRSVFSFGRKLYDSITSGGLEAASSPTTPDLQSRSPAQSPSPWPLHPGQKTVPWGSGRRPWTNQASFDAQSVYAGPQKPLPDPSIHRPIESGGGCKSEDLRGDCAGLADATSGGNVEDRAPRTQERAAFPHTQASADTSPQAEVPPTSSRQGDGTVQSHGQDKVDEPRPETVQEPEPALDQETAEGNEAKDEEDEEDLDGDEEDGDAEEGFIQVARPGTAVDTVRASEPCSETEGTDGKSSKRSKRKNRSRQLSTRSEQTGGSTGASTPTQEMFGNSTDEPPLITVLSKAEQRKLLKSQNSKTRRKPGSGRRS